MHIQEARIRNNEESLWIVIKIDGYWYRFQKLHSDGEISSIWKIGCNDFAVSHANPIDVTEALKLVKEMYSGQFPELP